MSRICECTKCLHRHRDQDRLEDDPDGICTNSVCPKCGHDCYWAINSKGKRCRLSEWDETTDDQEESDAKA